MYIKDVLKNGVNVSGVLDKWRDKIVEAFGVDWDINKISITSIDDCGFVLLIIKTKDDYWGVYVDDEQEFYKPILEELDRVLEIDINIANHWNKVTSNIGDDFLSNLTKAEDKYKSEIEELKAKLEAKDAEILAIKSSKSNLQEFHDIVNENNLMRELLKAVL